MMSPFFIWSRLTKAFKMVKLPRLIQLLTNQIDQSKGRIWYLDWLIDFWPRFYIMVLGMFLCFFMSHRVVARSENLGGHVVLGGDNVPPLVEIGLTYLSKTGGARPPRLRQAWTSLHDFISRTFSESRWSQYDYQKLSWHMESWVAQISFANGHEVLIKISCEPI